MEYPVSPFAEPSCACPVCTAYRRRSTDMPPPVRITGLPERERVVDDYPHGYSRGITLHREREETLCPKCDALSRSGRPCGTISGYRRHLDDGTKPCYRCKNAEERDLKVYYNEGTAEARYYGGR